jgi:hypothetical protein
MLFHVLWHFTDNTEEGQKRSLQVFQHWQRPTEAQFQGFYGFADNTGGVAIVEVDTAATLTRITAPFTAWLEFAATPILPIEEASAIAGEAISYRDSVR